MAANLDRRRHVVRCFAWLGALSVLAAATCGCSLLKAREDSKTFYASTVLVGRVSAPVGWQGPIVVSAYTKRFGRIAMTHCTRLHEAGGFELMVPNGGDYRLFAFSDGNGNLRFDAGEPSGSYLDAEPVKAAGTGVVANLDILVKDAAGQLPVPVGSEFSQCGAKSTHSTQAGAVATLDDPLFSAEYGSKAYWSGVEFFKEVGGNIYFLEPYDPARIPVLFVHGAGGTPQDFRYFAEHIDRKRYQAWFYYYPSGATIDSVAHLLGWKLLNLQLEYRFETLYIAAHSMGGLVVRDFLLNAGAQFPSIKLFVSLSTPWGGEPAAELGVQHSPAVIPAWIDMQPNGRFMQRIFAQPLPASVDYYLLFGFKGGYSMMRPNNDGTVTLTSELRKPAQAEAKRVYGFDEDHVSILSSAQVLAQLGAIMDATGDGRGSQSAGHVRVKFDRTGGMDGGTLLPPLLFLRPVDGGRAPVALPLVNEDADRDVGPIPAGEYDASLFADSFATEPRRVRIGVAAAQTPSLNFHLSPRGYVGGFVGTAVANLPAGSFVPPDPSLKIDSISLQGLNVAVRRELVPRADNGRFELIDRYIDGKDDAVESQFSFVDLPAGDYLLTIRAARYQPSSDRVTVVPGQPRQWAPVLLRSGN